MGTHIQLRNKLKGMWSLEFEMEKLICEDHWKAVGLTILPFTDAPLFRYEAYITENSSRAIRVSK